MNSSGLSHADSRIKRHRAILNGAGLFAAVALCPSAWAAEIKVELFGQPCLLTGPLDNATLRVVHEISPEQFPPSDSPIRLNGFVTKVANQKKVPASLQTYRTQLERHLKSLAVFHEGVEALRKSRKADEFMKVVRSSLKLPAGASASSAAPSGAQARREAAKKRLTRQKKPPSREASINRLEELATEAAAAKNDEIILDKMKDIYLGLTEPNPEEEFHKTIRKLGIRYQCAFDETRPELDEGDEPEDPNP